MVSEESKESTKIQNQSNTIENSQSMEGLFSPRFKSVAAMAGWDEESIIIASLIVEDTPERQFKQKKRSDSLFKTPPSTNSRRKRRDQKKSPVSISVPSLNLDEGEPEINGNERKNTEAKVVLNEENKEREDELDKENSGVSCSNSALPCMDKLREELSCAICLEICFEPSTTSCGHSFCKKCLRSAADKCGKKCPKCRQLISNGRSCTVNTVLWNTIQLLFPQEIEARKASVASNNREAEQQIPRRRRTDNDLTLERARPSRLSSRDVIMSSMLSQDEDTPLVERLQRRANNELIMQSFHSSRASSRDSTARRSRWSEEADTPPLAQRLRRREALERLISSREANGRRSRRRGIPSQDEDAALALRLQREEFMEAFRGNQEQSGSSLSSARANLRAMASRAVSVRTGDQPFYFS